MSIIFFGSSEFSISALKACQSSKHPILKVISTPPRKKGRGLNEIPTPVAEFAVSHHLPLITPETLKSPELLQEIQALNPDFFVVSSYGKMIPSAWLRTAKKLNLNVHPSLLPKYRGASPINAPILNGDHETAISIAEVTDKLDAGDIFYQKRISLPADINSVELEKILADLSIPALEEVFKRIENNTLKRTAQNETLTSYAPKLKKEDGIIQWTESAEKILRKVRGLLPWPTAYTYFANEPFQILNASVISASGSAVPGSIIEIEKQGGLHVQTGNGVLNALRVKPAGKKEMSGSDFARGQRLAPGFQFTETQKDPS